MYKMRDLRFTITQRGKKPDKNSFEIDKKNYKISLFRPFMAIVVYGNASFGFPKIETVADCNIICDTHANIKTGDHCTLKLSAQTDLETGDNCNIQTGYGYVTGKTGNYSIITANGLLIMEVGRECIINVNRADSRIKCGLDGVNHLMVGQGGYRSYTRLEAGDRIRINDSDHGETITLLNRFREVLVADKPTIVDILELDHLKEQISELEKGEE